MIDHRRRAHNPGITLSGLWIPPTLGAEHASLFLSLADEHHAFWLVEVTQLLLHHVILALSLLEWDQRHAVVFGEALGGSNEGLGDWVHQRRRGELTAAVAPKESHHTALALQRRHVDVEVHPIDALQLKDDVRVHDFKVSFLPCATPSSLRICH